MSPPLTGMGGGSNYTSWRFSCASVFAQEQIYALGDSRGSALGIMLVQHHPELFHAFIGTGQMVVFLQNDLRQYEMAARDVATSARPVPAPHKEFVWSERCGHNVLTEESDRVADVLVSGVLVQGHGDRVEVSAGSSA
jgi:hypothetical protein